MEVREKIMQISEIKVFIAKGKQNTCSERELWGLKYREGASVGLIIITLQGCCENSRYHETPWLTSKHLAILVIIAVVP